MPNKNYINGRAFEYKVVKQFKKLGYSTVFRSAGSHSPWDVVALLSGARPVFIQCKRVKTKVQAKRMGLKFEDNPPMDKSDHYTQSLQVYVPKLRTTFETFV